MPCDEPKHPNLTGVEAGRTAELSRVGLMVLTAAIADVAAERRRVAAARREEGMATMMAEVGDVCMWMASASA